GSPAASIADCERFDAFVSGSWAQLPSSTRLKRLRPITGFCIWTPFSTFRAACVAAARRLSDAVRLKTAVGSWRIRRIRIRVRVLATARTERLAAALRLPYAPDRQGDADEQEHTGQEHIAALILAIGDDQPEDQQGQGNRDGHDDSP